MKNKVSRTRLASFGREEGITAVEMVLVGAILGIVIFSISQLIRPIVTYLQRSPARQQAQIQMRVCMETIHEFMSNGKAGTLVIATPATTPTIQFSSATFQSQDGSMNTFYWSNSPAGSVHFRRTPPAGIATDTVLATNVTNLTFGVAVNDPAIVTVTLQMTIPMDSSGSPSSFFTIQAPVQTIRMIAW